MVGILIVSHGAFGKALIRCASHVLGERPSRVENLDVTARDDPDAILLPARDSPRPSSVLYTGSPNPSQLSSPLQSVPDSARRSATRYKTFKLGA